LTAAYARSFARWKTVSDAATASTAAASASAAPTPAAHRVPGASRRRVQAKMMPAVTSATPESPRRSSTSMNRITACAWSCRKSAPEASCLSRNRPAAASTSGSGTYRQNRVNPPTGRGATGVSCQAGP
jgi:hypothetical protein